jgi:hypothetical protein
VSITVNVYARPDLSSLPGSLEPSAPIPILTTNGLIDVERERPCLRILLESWVVTLCGIFGLPQDPYSQGSNSLSTLNALSEIASRLPTRRPLTGSILNTVTKSSYSTTDLSWTNEGWRNPPLYPLYPGDHSISSSSSHFFDSQPGHVLVKVDYRTNCNLELSRKNLCLNPDLVRADPELTALSTVTYGGTAWSSSVPKDFPLHRWSGNPEDINEQILELKEWPLYAQSMTSKIKNQSHVPFGDIYGTSPSRFTSWELVNLHACSYSALNRNSYIHGHPHQGLKISRSESDIPLAAEVAGGIHSRLPS